MTIAHISDIHFGKISHVDIVEQMVNEINEHTPAAVVVSGDLTQRARRGQFREAAKMLEMFEAPLVVVPGNHDVAAWYRPFRRLRSPLKRYRKFISHELSPTFDSDEIAVYGLNSAHGLTIKGGWIRSGHIQAMKSFFKEKESRFKVVAVHHHLTSISALGAHDVARNGPRALQAAAAVGVELILCGHLHQSHVETVAFEKEGHQVVIASAGTATSSRGRKEDRMVNFYNFITLGEKNFIIEERQFDLESRKFSTHRESEFKRTV